MQDMTVDKVWLTDTAVWIHPTDGKEAEQTPCGA